MRQPLEESESGGALIAAGATYLVIDAPSERLSHDEVLSRAFTFQPDLIVLAVTFGSLEADLVWAARLRAIFPQCLIGLRGAPCYVWDTELLRDHNAVDFIVRGDYELVFTDIATFGLSSARGVTYRNSTGITVHNAPAYAPDLDTLPRADRSGIELLNYRIRGFGNPQATVRVQRGCPYTCTYCLVHTVSGNTARHRSPQSIASEVRELQARGITFFFFRAETFSLDRQWTLELCQTLARECAGIRWVTTTRVECVDEEVVAAMAQAGCYGLSFGVDVASDTIGKKVKKRPRLSDATRAMRLCDKYQILSLAYVMIGFLWETRDTLKETAEFIRTIRPDLITIHYAFPYPGTKYFEEVTDAGLSAVTSEAQASPALALEQIPIAELRRFANALTRRHYLRFTTLKAITPKLVRLAKDAVLTRLRA